MRNLFYDPKDRMWTVRINVRHEAARYEKFKHKVDAKRFMANEDNKMVKHIKVFWSTTEEVYNVYELTRAGKRKIASFKTKEEVKEFVGN